MDLEANRYEYVPVPRIGFPRASTNVGAGMLIQGPILRLARVVYRAMVETVIEGAGNRADEDRAMQGECRGRARGVAGGGTDQTGGQEHRQQDTSGSAHSFQPTVNVVVASVWPPITNSSL